MTKSLLTRFLGGIVAALSLTFQLASPVGAETEKTGSDVYVVLVGISKYADAQIKPRPHAEADARAVHKVLTNKASYDGKKVHARLLLGDADNKTSQPATRENILDALRWIAKEAGPTDQVFFGFFGQGGPVGKLGTRRCYFASDSTFNKRAKTAVAAEEIADILKPLKSKRFAVLLDVNFKGFVMPKTPVAEPTLGSSPYSEFLGADEDDDHVGTPGRAVFLATTGLKPSLDLKDHGVFARAVVKGLKGAADKEGYEADGLITVGEMKTYLNKEIAELARTHGETKEEKSQININLSTRESRFVLAINPPARAQILKQIAALESLGKSGKLSAKFLAEGKKLLNRMPRLEAQRELRKEYQQLAAGKLTLAKFEAERTKILDSTKMKRTLALDFARQVLDGIQVIEEGYVKKVDRGEMVGWAVKGLYEYAREKIPEKLQAQLKDVKTMRPGALAVFLADSRQALGIREDLKDDKDLHVALRQMLSHLDPYTTYIDPEMQKKFKPDIDGNFTGIGIQIRKDVASDQLLVVTPIKGSPAYKAGLMEGDLITTIKRRMDSEGNPLDDPEIIPTKGLDLNQAVKKILGLPGTEVTLTIQREGKAKPFDVSIRRGRVDLESVMGVKRKANDEWDFWLDEKKKIGYIRLTSFARNSYRELRRVMQDLDRQGLKGFILDLRFNPGGLLDSAIEISDLYVDDGVIVSIRPRGAREARFRGEHRGSMLNFPMVCLVNGGSASGSEIVSACLQDHGRALIVGERSYGKGSVQNLHKFAGGQLKLTTATFWRPSGKNLNKSSTKGLENEDWGVRPDLLVKLSRKERQDLMEYQRDTEIIHRADKPPKKSKFKDRQLEEALQYLHRQIPVASRGVRR